MTPNEEPPDDDMDDESFADMAYEQLNLLGETLGTTFTAPPPRNGQPTATNGAAAPARTAPMHSFRKFNKRRRKEYLAAMAEGSSKATAAESVGVSREYVRLYRNAYPEFAVLEEEAEYSAHGKVEDALYQAAISGNVVACFSWLQNRVPERWQDKRLVRNEFTGANGGPIELRAVSDEELGRRIAELENRLRQAAGGEGTPHAALEGPAGAADGGIQE